MVDIITGQRSTTDINQVRRVVDIADKIYLLNPNAAPLTVLSSKLKKRNAINPEFKWLESDIFPYWDAVNNVGGYSAAATSIVVDNAIFRTGDLIKVPRTGEVMLVTNYTTVTLTVVRGVGSSAAAILNDDEPLMKLAMASEEGSTPPDVKTLKSVDKYNYTQIIKTPFDETGTAAASEYYGGKDRAFLRKVAGIEHMIDIERAFWFGQRGTYTLGTKIKRFMGGVLEYVTTNVLDAGGILTESEFEGMCRTAFKYGSTTKWGFCSPLAASVINLWAAGKLQTVPGEKTYGVAVKKYITIHGELNLVINKLFEGTTYGGLLAILDLEDIEYRPLQTRDTKLETNIQANNVDGWQDQYKTEVGIEVRNEKKHTIITDIEG